MEVLKAVLILVSIFNLGVSVVLLCLLSKLENLLEIPIEEEEVRMSYNKKEILDKFHKIERLKAAFGEIDDYTDKHNLGEVISEESRELHDMVVNYTRINSYEIIELMERSLECLNTK